MKIGVKVRVGKRENKASEHFDKLSVKERRVFVVSVRELPVEGKANLAVVKVLAKYFGVAQKNIRLISGASSKQKIFEVLE